MRTIVGSLVAFVVCLGITMADEFTASISKIEGNKVTLTKLKKGEKGESMTLTAAADVKVVKGKFNKEAKKIEAGDPIDGGLKAEVLNTGKATARVVTDNDNKITEIRVLQAKKKN